MRALGKGTTRKNQLHYSQKGDLHDSRKIVSKAVGFRNASGTSLKCHNVATR